MAGYSCDKRLRDAIEKVIRQIIIDRAIDYINEFDSGIESHLNEIMSQIIDSNQRLLQGMLSTKISSDPTMTME